MHILIAFLTPVFAATLYPVTGGELSITQQTVTSEVVLEINASSICTVNLTETEALVVADVVTDVTDNGGLGKTVPLAAGGGVQVLSLGYGNVRISTRQLSICRLALRASEGEPDALIDMLTDAAGP